MIRIAPIAAAAVIGILATAPGASGQAVIDQYVPQANPAGGAGTATGGGGNSDTLAPIGKPGGHAVAIETDHGSSHGGHLPFTSYPVTPFVWIVLAVLAVAALVVAGAHLIRRRGPASAS